MLKIFTIVFLLFSVPPGLTSQMRLNGALDGQPAVKKRRGRKKNVEGMDMLFMNRNQVPAAPHQVRGFFMLKFLHIFKLYKHLPFVHNNFISSRLQVPPGWGGIGQVGMSAAAMPNYSPSTSQVPADTESRVPVINLKDGTRLAGDDAPKKKDLEQWLSEHPGFVADTGAFIPVSPSVVFISSILDAIYS